MARNLAAHLRKAFNENRSQSLTFLLCVLFGLAMIADTQTAGDGGWFWYATFFRGGQRLYSGMHLALQPLFVLETASFLALFGKGWLVSKLPAVLHLLAYCIGLLLLARSSSFTGRQKPSSWPAPSSRRSTSSANRFDDYHVLADCFEVYSFLLLLALQRASLPWRSAGLAAALGLLSGLALMTRPNDGAALFVGVALCILFLAPARRCSRSPSSPSSRAHRRAVVRLTGDSLHDWASNSLFKAAASKGGAGNVLAAPSSSPQRYPLPRQSLRHPAPRLGPRCRLCLAPSFVRSSSTANRQTPSSSPPLPPSSCFPSLTWAATCWIRSQSFFPRWALSSPAARLRSRLSLPALALRTNPSAPWDPREALLLIPLGQLASGSMSTGGSPLGLNTALATLLLLLPIAGPIRLKRESTRAFAFALLAFSLSTCAAHKYRYPYQWHSYNVAHPVHRPPVVPPSRLRPHPHRARQHRLHSAHLQRRPSRRRPAGLALPALLLPQLLLRRPPLARLRPDLLRPRRQTIQTLIADLQSAPPKWIVYQRQPYNLALHEQIFNHGQPLPHRALDQLIEQKIASGEWQPTYTSTYGSNGPFTDQWLLLRTRP